MRRRRLLAALGAAGASALAGCNDGEQAAGEKPGTQSSRPTEEAVSTDTAAGTGTATPPTGAEGTTATEAGATGPSPELVTGDPELTRVDFGDYSGPAAEVDLVNTGDAPARAVTLRFDWLDGDDDLIESGTELVPTLAPGETFRPRVVPSRTRYAESVETVEPVIEGDVEAATELDPDGVALVGRRLRATEDIVRLRGTVRNDRETGLDRITAAGKVYDAEGVALAITATSESGLRPGGSWQFGLLPDTVGRNGAVESAAVVLSTEQLIL